MGKQRNLEAENLLKKSIGDEEDLNNNNLINSESKRNYQSKDKDNQNILNSISVKKTNRINADTPFEVVKTPNTKNFLSEPVSSRFKSIKQSKDFNIYKEREEPKVTERLKKNKSQNNINNKDIQLKNNNSKSKLQNDKPEKTNRNENVNLKKKDYLEMYAKSLIEKKNSKNVEDTNRGKLSKNLNPASGRIKDQF